MLLSLRRQSNWRGSARCDSTARSVTHMARLANKARLAKGELSAGFDLVFL